VPARRRLLMLLLGMLLPLAFLPAAADAAPGVIAPVSEWTQFGHDARHPNVNPDEHAFSVQNVNRLKVVGKGHLGDNSLSFGGAAVAGGTAYIGDSDGNLSAFPVAECSLGTSCEPLWQGQLGETIADTPAVADGVVLIGATDHKLSAFAAAGCGGAAVCKPLWQGQLQDGPLESSPAVVDGIAYIGDFSGRLYAFRVAGCGQALCQPLWVGRAGPNEELISSPAVANGNVYIGSTINTPDDVTGRLLVFPAAGCGRAECQPTWTADAGGPVGQNLAPVVSNDTVYVASSTRFGGPDKPAHMFAFPAAGCGASVCKPLRTYNLPLGAVAGPTLAGSTLLVSTQDSPDPNFVGAVAAFPAAGCGRPSCDPVWTGVTGASGFESPPAVAGGVVFIEQGPASGFPVDAGMFAYDLRGCGAAVCQPLTFVQFSDQQVYLGSPFAIAGGKLFAESNDNIDNHTNLYILSVPAIVQQGRST
jgi:outer membrane protein assembly factor BamB